jgi:DNA-binding protein YbaB
MQKASDGLQAARERLASLTGTGTAADGKIKVTWASATGLDQLHLEPRAMRMASEELSAAIKQAIADAIADLRRQTAEVLQQEAGVSTRGGAKRVEEMREAFNGQMDEISNRIHDAKRAMERALMR